LATGKERVSFKNGVSNISCFSPKNPKKTKKLNSSKIFKKNLEINLITNIKTNIKTNQKTNQKMYKATLCYSEVCEVL